MKVFKWSALSALILIVAGLAFLRFGPGYDMYFVRSESMAPVINLGDLVITGPVGAPIIGEVKPGAIVTFKTAKNKLITHRVLSVKGDKLVTKGDALEDPDPFSVTMSQVEGIYLFRIPGVGYVISFIRTRLGWWLLIILPAMALVSLLIKDILKEALSSSE